MKVLSFPALVLAAGGVAATALAAPPPSINLHGQLIGPGGVPVSGDRVYEVTFYDQETGGNVLGTPLTGTATVSDQGLFNVVVSPPAAIFSAAEIWYELGVDTDDPVDNDASDDVFPNRIRVYSVPFALQAEEVVAVPAERVGNGDVDDTELSALDGVTSNIQAQIDGIDSTVDKDAINNAGVLGFEWSDAEVADALTIGSTGSVNNGAFSALSDLNEESAVGTGSGQVAAGDHDHQLQDLSGAVTDAQVPDALTIQGGMVDNDSFSAISDLGEESAIGTGSGQVAAGDHDHLLQDLSGAVTDAQVSNDITITETDTLASVTGRGASTSEDITLSGAAQSITFTNATGNVSINSDSVLGLGLEGLTVLNGTLSSVGQVLFDNDSATNPAMTYSSDPNTGVHRPGADQLAMVTGGASRLTVDNSEVNLTGNILEIASGTAPGTTANKLYNVGGNLFWNGTQLEGGGGGGADAVALDFNGGGGSTVSAATLYQYKFPKSGSVIDVQTYCFQADSSGALEVEIGGTSVLTSPTNFVTATIVEPTLKSNGDEDFSAGDVMVFRTTSSSTNLFAYTITVTVEYN